MNDKIEKTERKQVLIRVPLAMYNDLLNLSAAATLLSRRSTSVPALILQILEDDLRSRHAGGRLP